MCLILLAYRTHPRYPLIVAANRDEFHDRPSAPASFWDTDPEILAGRDLRCGGTWLGVSRDGRIAALTNYYDPCHRKTDAPSRGALVAGYLLGGMAPGSYLEILRSDGVRHNGYSLIFGSGENLFCYSNRGEDVLPIEPGIHGLSNHLLNTPWPKVVRGKTILGNILQRGDEPSTEALFEMLADRTVNVGEPPTDLAITPEKEFLYSNLFIDAPGYGTRSSTVVLFDRDSAVTFMERTYSVDRNHFTTVTFRFRVEGSQREP